MPASFFEGHRLHLQEDDNMNEEAKDQVRAAVREQYRNVARSNGTVGCACGQAGGSER